MELEEYRNQWNVPLLDTYGGEENLPQIHKEGGVIANISSFLNK